MASSREVERALEAAGNFDYHIHSFFKNFDIKIQDEEPNNLSKIIPKAWKTIIELNAKIFNRQNQFILEAYLICVVMYQWTVEQFMTKSALFSSIPKKSKPYQLIFQYLQEFMRYIAEPIAPIHDQDSSDQKTEIDDDDDDEEEKDDSIYDLPLSLQLQHNTFNKHKLERLLHYIFIVHQAMRTKNHRQIDMVFIPKKLHQINDDFFKARDVKYIKSKSSEFQDIKNLLDRFHSVRAREKAHFSRGIMLITVEDVVYLFESLTPIPDGILHYTEIPMIYNSTHKNPMWLDSMMKTYNGLIVSYHRHNVVLPELPQLISISTRLYVWYKSMSGRCYGTRLLKEHMIDILKGFCYQTDDWKQCWEDEEEVKFIDAAFADFVHLHLKDLKIKVELNDNNCMIVPINYQISSLSLPSDWSNDGDNSHMNNRVRNAQSVLSDSGSISNQSGNALSLQSDWNSDQESNDNHIPNASINSVL